MITSLHFKISWAIDFSKQCGGGGGGGGHSDADLWVRILFRKSDLIDVFFFFC